MLHCSMGKEAATGHLWPPSLDLMVPYKKMLPLVGIFLLSPCHSGEVKRPVSYERRWIDGGNPPFYATADGGDAW